MSGIVGLVLVVAALIVVGVTLVVVGRRRERHGLAGDLAHPRADTKLPQVGQDTGSKWFSGGWGGGTGGGGS